MIEQLAQAVCPAGCLATSTACCLLGCLTACKGHMLLGKMHRRLPSWLLYISSRSGSWQGRCGLCRRWAPCSALPGRTRFIYRAAWSESKKDMEGRHGNCSQKLTCGSMCCCHPGADVKRSAESRGMTTAAPGASTYQHHKQCNRRSCGTTASHKRLFTEPARLTERLTVPVRRSNYLHP